MVLSWRPVQSARNRQKETEPGNRGNRVTGDQVQAGLVVLDGCCGTPRARKSLLEALHVLRRKRIGPATNPLQQWAAVWKTADNAHIAHQSQPMQLEVVVLQERT